MARPKMRKNQAPKVPYMLALLPTAGALQTMDFSFSEELMALRPERRAFVWALLELGTNRFGEAAKAAGLGTENSDPKYLDQLGRRLAHDYCVQTAIAAETKRRMRANVPMAVTVLESIMSNPTAEDRDRLKAVEMLFNRTGLHEMREEKVTVNHTVDDKELRQQILQMARETGQDPAKFLGNKIQDAEFEDVTDEVEAEDDDDLEGLIYGNEDREPAQEPRGPEGDQAPPDVP